MAEYSSLLDEVTPDCAGVTVPIAIRAIRDSVIELCERTFILKRNVDSQVVTAEQPRVVITATAGHRLVHLKNVTLDSRPVHHTSQDALDLAWKDSSDPLRRHVHWHHCDGDGGGYETWRAYKQDRPRLYYLELQDDGDRIRFVGIPERSYTNLEYTKVICPLRDSTGTDTWLLERYYQQLKWGALGKLMTMPTERWTNAVTGAMYAEKFEQWLLKAEGDAARDFVRDDESVGRVTSHY